MKALPITLVLVLLMSFLVLVLVLPGEVKDSHAGYFLGLLAVLTTVLSVGLVDRYLNKNGEKP